MRRWWNPFSWGGFTKQDIRNAHLEAWEDEDFLREYHNTMTQATAEDTLDFVFDF